jgi:hypothetical protein
MFSDHLEDHGVPLVQLKEQRRELIVALLSRTGRITKRQIAEIAAIQQAIAAAEAVVADSIPNSLRRCCVNAVPTGL